MLNRYKPLAEKILTPVAKKLNWLHPNAITMIGIIPQILFFIFMQNHQYLYAAIALVFSFLDLLDGMVARLRGKITPFGALFDSTMDRVSDFLIIAGLYVGGIVSLELTALLLITTYLISYIRARAEAASLGKIKFDRGIIERTERIILIFFSVILATYSPSSARLLIIFLITLSVVTVAQRIWFAFQTLRTP